MDSHALWCDLYDPLDETLASFVTDPIQWAQPTNYMSYDELLSSGSFIPTTKRKKKIIDELHDYWNLKGLLLKIKRSPALLQHQSSRETIVEFLDNHSDLPGYAFWTHLTQLQKLSVARRFHVIEGHSKKVHMHYSPSNPELFVVLSGNVEVLPCSDDRSNVAVHYGHGNVFGNIDLFNRPYINSTNATDILSSPIASASEKKDTMTCISMCTLLKLFHRDYLFDAPLPMSVGAPYDEEYVRANRPDLHTDDILCLGFYSKIKAVISETLYDFLVNNNILPQTSKSPSYQYMRIGNVGRHLNLSLENVKTVYIVMEGSMRLQLIQPRTGSDFSSYSSFEILCRREDDTSILMKVPSLPAVGLGVGNVFIINETCFNLHQEISKQKRVLPVLKSSLYVPSVYSASVQSLSADPLPDHSHQNSTGSCGNSLVNFGENESIGDTTVGMSKAHAGLGLGTSRFNTSISSDDQRQHRCDKNKSATLPELYNVQIVFETSTKYLAIPIEVIRSGMKRTSIDVNKEVTRQLNQISVSINSRILQLLPLIMKNKELCLKDRIPQHQLPLQLKKQQAPLSARKA